MSTRIKIIGISLLIGLFIWLIDALLDFYFYESSFIDLLILNVPDHGIYLRLVVLFCLLLFGFIIAEFIGVREQALSIVSEREKQLTEQNRDYKNLNDDYQRINDELRKNNMVMSKALEMAETKLRGLGHDNWLS